MDKDNSRMILLKRFLNGDEFPEGRPMIVKFNAIMEYSKLLPGVEYPGMVKSSDSEKYSETILLRLWDPETKNTVIFTLTADMIAEEIVSIEFRG